MQAAGYRIQETVHQGKRFTVYHAFKQQDQRSCYLKVLEKRRGTRSRPCTRRGRNTSC